MECLLRVIDGPDQGLEHLLQAGPNLIGRGNRAALQLTPEDVSWEHAVVTRQGEEYFVENLSALGTWVGDAKIVGRVRLRPRDELRLTKDTVLRMEPVDGGGLLGSRAFLATAVVTMTGVLVAVLFFQGKGGAASSQPDDWQGAFNTLSAWLEKQSAEHRVAPGSAELFRNAWRLEQAGDYAHSQADWLKLQVVLAAAEGTLHSLDIAGRDPTDKTLQRFLSPQTPGLDVPDEDAAGATAEFVRRRLAFSTKEAAPSLLKPT